MESEIKAISQIKKDELTLTWSKINVLLPSSITDKKSETLKNDHIIKNSIILL
jgi:hypothetical protein